MDARDGTGEMFTFRELAELLGRRIGPTEGRRRLELLYEDGRLVDTYLHSRYASRELEQLLVDLSPTAARSDD